MEASFYIQVTDAFVDGGQKKLTVGCFKEVNGKFKTLREKTYDVSDFTDTTVDAKIAAIKAELEATPEATLTSNHKTTYVPFDAKKPNEMS